MYGLRLILGTLHPQHGIVDRALEQSRRPYRREITIAHLGERLVLGVADQLEEFDEVLEDPTIQRREDGHQVAELGDVLAHFRRGHSLTVGKYAHK